VKTNLQKNVLPKVSTEMGLWAAVYITTWKQKRGYNALFYFSLCLYQGRDVTLTENLISDMFTQCFINECFLLWFCIHVLLWVGLGLSCWMPFSTIFQFYWWRKPGYPEKSTDRPQVADKLYHIHVMLYRVRLTCTHNFSGDRHWSYSECVMHTCIHYITSTSSLKQ